MSQQQVQFRRGELVEVRPFSEICRTLDPEQMLNGLPFMPEMANLCGKRMRILNRADHIEADSYGMRRMPDSVLLEGVRCNGLHHGNCQRGCMILWRSAWLKPIDGSLPIGQHQDEDSFGAFKWATNQNGRYICQCTQLAKVSTPLHFLDIRQYVRNIYWGIFDPSEQIRILGRHLTNKIRRFYDHKKPPSLKPTSPVENSNALAPNEWVEVKSLEEIEQTLDRFGKNRGLLFMNEMRKYCGRSYQVHARISRIIKDTDGRMIELKNTVVLKDVICDGSCHFGCPRQSWLFWREEWLRRIPVVVQVNKSTSTPLKLTAQNPSRRQLLL